ncbi:MAG TPA: tRNA (adenosine(37)-N6)-dimethylallyltransferase MiaA [Candidatus Gallimonas gallistercoris]|uniref:tRNA dimethylallyltransferase n=1 Tax=Candidatus Gallimonas gallistercoris TaxID=2838602 RepID=A0A9D2H142_9FIRM|nr:tRNA (adenosine(37)-N6)-dimethylallyltransferase MiaA [Candidatus Gallimonas gallistercoris]
MKALVISGPTASGKTALSVECAKRLNGEIVSADALLVYKGLNIGTAKPTKGEMGGIPHYMIDVVAPTESFSASDYERLALPILEDIVERGKVPVLVGGTSFYLDALLYKRTLGGAPADEAVRKKYEAIFEREGKEALFSLLQEIDPASAEVLHPNDKKRVIRALEIYELTGKRKSEQHDERIPRLPVLAVGVYYPREELYARIDARVDGMIKSGLVEEVEGLLNSGISENAQCMQGIGYKEVVEILKNSDLHSTMSYKINAMSGIIKKNTRNYAKRQLTYLRKRNVVWLAPKPVEELAQEVCLLYEGN